MNPKLKNLLFAGAVAATLGLAACASSEENMDAPPAEPAPADSGMDSGYPPPATDPTAPPADATTPPPTTP